MQTILLAALMLLAMVAGVKADLNVAQPSALSGW
jgi:hypothetical protein